MLVLYITIMSALIAGLGCVPVLSLFSSSKGSSGGGDSGGSGSSPAPAGGGSETPSSSSTWVLVLIHITNGLIMMGVVGLTVSMLMGILRACGYTGLVFMPDPFCPGCLWCMDLNGGPGLGWAPFVECSGAGECGLVLLAILVVVMLIVGITAAMYMLYAVLWALVQQGLDKAQSMVENVQPEGHEARPEGRGETDAAAAR
jgi:hypothetical protein